MSLNSAPLNGVVLNGAIDLEPAPLVVSFARRFHLKLFDESGTYLSYLDTVATASSWEESINQPETLEFVVSPKHEAAANGDLRAPNVVRLYDAGWQWLRTFEVVRSQYRGNSRERTLQVTCRGLMGRLERERLTNYTDVNGSTTKIIDHLVDWLDGTGISVGFVEASIAQTVLPVGELDKTPILSAIAQLHSVAGGRYTVDKVGNFNWYALHPDAAVDVVHLKENLVDYGEERDDLEIANDITVVGGLDPSTGSPFIAQGQDAASVAQFGTKKLTLTSRLWRSQEMVDGILAKKLDELAFGKTIRRIGMVDLSQVPSTLAAMSNDPNQLYPGLPLKTVPPSEAIDPSLFNSTVASVRRELGNPANVDIQIGEAPRGNWLSRLARNQKDNDDEDDEQTEEDERIYQTIAALTFTDLFDTPNDYSSAAGKAVKVNDSETALIFDEAGGKFPAYNNFTELQNAGVPDDKPSWAQVIADGKKSGIWMFPAEGTVVAHWQKVWPYAIEVEALSELDYSINEHLIVFVGAGFAEHGVWFKPADAADEDDCFPANAIIAFDSS